MIDGSGPEPVVKCAHITRRSKLQNSIVVCFADCPHTRAAAAVDNLHRCDVMGQHHRCCVGLVCRRQAVRRHRCRGHAVRLRTVRHQHERARVRHRAVLRDGGGCGPGAHAGHHGPAQLRRRRVLPRRVVQQPAGDAGGTGAVCTRQQDGTRLWSPGHGAVSGAACCDSRCVCGRGSVLVAMACWMARWRSQGLQRAVASGRRLVVFTSDQSHYSIKRCALLCSRSCVNPTPTAHTLCLRLCSLAAHCCGSSTDDAVCVNVCVRVCGCVWLVQARAVALLGLGHDAMVLVACTPSGAMDPVDFGTLLPTCASRVCSPCWNPSKGR